MFTRTTLAFALVIGTASVSLSQEADPNLLNRYPAHNMTQQVWSPSPEIRSVALTGHTAVMNGEWMRFDRASRTGGL